MHGFIGECRLRFFGEKYLAAATERVFQYALFKSLRSPRLGEGPRAIGNGAARCGRVGSTWFRCCSGVSWRFASLLSPTDARLPPHDET